MPPGPNDRLYISRFLRCAPDVFEAGRNRAIDVACARSWARLALWSRIHPSLLEPEIGIEFSFVPQSCTEPKCYPTVMIAKDQTTSPATLDPSLDYDVLIIGAGQSGMYSLHRMRQLGLKSLVLEAGSGEGGTWFWYDFQLSDCTRMERIDI